MSTRTVPGPRCTIVICAYTPARWDLLARGYAETVVQLTDRDELVVVIDHHRDLEARARAAFGQARVVANGHERGLSGARNTGVEHASGEFVVFLDDDAAPEAGWLDAYRHRFADPAIAVVSGAVTAEWAAGPGGVAGPPRWFPEEFGWVVGCDYRGLPPDGAPVRNAIGANMAVRHSALTGVGGFVSDVGRVGDLPVGGEETDLCIRIRQADPAAVIVRDTSARVRHTVSPARRRLRYFASRCYHEGRSKAVLAARVGAGDGLSSERGYVTRVLTTGAARHTAAVGTGDLAGVARAAAIGLGLAATAVGYFTTRAVRRSPRPDAPHPGWQPMVVSEFRLGTGRDVPYAPGRRTRLLVTSAGAPLGCVDVPPAEQPPSRAQLVALASSVEIEPADDDVPLFFADPVFQPPVSVVIPTRGRAGELVRCVRSILALDYRDFEVLVVDNNDDPEAVPSLLAPLRSDSRLRIVRQPDRGVSPARNLGIENARHELIAATDDDVTVSAQWLAELVAPFADPRIDCVTGLVVPDGFSSPAQEMFEEYGGFGKGFQPTLYDLAEHRGDHILYPYSPGAYGSGNNVAYRRGRVAALGGYDRHLGPGTPARAGEDLDLFLKVLFAGGAIYYQPRAWVRHYHRDNVAALQSQLRDYGRGLSAVIVSWALSDRRRAAEIVRVLPAGLRYLFDPRSAKNTNRSASYPGALRRAELRGLVEGAALTLLRRPPAGRPRHTPLVLTYRTDALEVS